MDYRNYSKVFLGLTTNEELKNQIKAYLDNKTHSCAYLKVCASELKRLGFLSLGLAMEDIAYKKMNYEAALMEAFGMKDDLRLNLNNVLIRAEEDVKFAKEIEKLAKEKEELEVYSLMHELAKSEATNLTCIMSILDKYLKESKSEAN